MKGELSLIFDSLKVCPFGPPKWFPGVYIHSLEENTPGESDSPEEHTVLYSQGVASNSNMFESKFEIIVGDESEPRMVKKKQKQRSKSRISVS